MTAAFGADRVQRTVPLAPLTTFHVGGPADWLVEVHNGRELVEALQIASASTVPVTVLGGGSNVLISDRGIRGLVIRVRGGEVERIGTDLVRGDAGVTINGVVRWTINRGLGGLEAWAGTPGTIGGAVYGNAHFNGRLLSEIVHSVRVATREGQVSVVPASELQFGYDQSRLQRTGETLVSADFRVWPADVGALRSTARASLAYRKRTQPLNAPSAGCIFQNPDPSDSALPVDVPASAGALIDRAGLKGHAIGGARVSPTHANFIVNEGSATAAEIRDLIALCHDRVRAAFGVDLKEEIVRLGEFD